MDSKSIHKLNQSITVHFKMLNGWSPLFSLQPRRMYQMQKFSEKDPRLH